MGDAFAGVESSAALPVCRSLPRSAAQEALRAYAHVEAKKGRPKITFSHRLRCAAAAVLASGAPL